MGVSCHVTLPHETRLTDVVKVLGALAGNPLTREDFGGGHEGWSACLPADTLRTANTSVIGMAQILGVAANRPSDPDFYCFYHFESKNGRLLMPPSTAWWIAVGRGLVAFFGGSVVASDCDGKTIYRKPKQKDIHAEDGAAWYRLQNRLLTVKPLTEEDIKKCEKWAAYR